MSVDDGAPPTDAVARIAEIAHCAAAELPGADYANDMVTSGPRGESDSARPHGHSR